MATGLVLGLAVLVGRAVIGSGAPGSQAPVIASPPAQSPTYYQPSIPQAEPVPATPAPIQITDEPYSVPASTTGTPSSGLQARAETFANTYFESWSGDDAGALDFIDRHYAPTVLFYGVPKSRAEIARMKYAFVRRWPDRSYRPDPSQMTIDCNEAQGICSVSGVVFYQAHSDARNATSSGTAMFQMGLRMVDGEFQIISENGRTQQRDP